MPIRAEVETALKAKASSGKIKVEDVLSYAKSLKVDVKTIEDHLKDHKDAEGKVELEIAVNYIASL